MSTKKMHLSVTVDLPFIEAGRNAVSEGRAASLSAWVNAALAERVSKESRIRALAGAVAAYEQRAGPISAQELADQAQADRKSAVIVRGR